MGLHGADAWWFVYWLYGVGSIQIWGAAKEPAPERTQYGNVEEEGTPSGTNHRDFWGSNSESVSSGFQSTVAICRLTLLL
jgi:hypothetical protein